jgi:hypothetical protein
MVKHRAFTKIISVTVGPNDPGGEKNFPVAEIRVRALSLYMADREGGLDVAIQPGPDVPKKPVVPAYSLDRPGIEPL